MQHRYQQIYSEGIFSRGSELRGVDALCADDDVDDKTLCLYSGECFWNPKKNSHLSLGATKNKQSLDPIA